MVRINELGAAVAAARALTASLALTPRAG